MGRERHVAVRFLFVSSNVIIDQGPAWYWIVLPAFTGLLGAGLVAWWQGRQGIDRWRRERRIAAYSDFISAHHAFEAQFPRWLVPLSINPYSPDSVEAQHTATSLVDRIRSCLSVIDMVGPEKVRQLAKAASATVDTAIANSGTMAAVMKSGGASSWDSYQTSLSETRRKFTEGAQEVLGTHD